MKNPFPIKFITTGGHCDPLKFNQHFRIGPWVGILLFQCRYFVVMGRTKNSFKQ